MWFAQLRVCEFEVIECDARCVVDDGMRGLEYGVCAQRSLVDTRAQCTRERRGLLALFCREVTVARTHRESVGFTNRRAPDDFQPHTEVAGHLRDEDQLLVVLFAEHCEVLS